MNSNLFSWIDWRSSAICWTSYREREKWTDMVNIWNWHYLPWGSQPNQSICSDWCSGGRGKRRVDSRIQLSTVRMGSADWSIGSGHSHPNIIVEHCWTELWFIAGWSWLVWMDLISWIWIQLKIWLELIISDVTEPSRSFLIESVGRCLENLDWNSFVCHYLPSIFMYWTFLLIHWNWI